MTKKKITREEIIKEALKILPETQIEFDTKDSTSIFNDKLNFKIVDDAEKQSNELTLLEKEIIQVVKKMFLKYYPNTMPGYFELIFNNDFKKILLDMRKFQW